MKSPSAAASVTRELRRVFWPALGEERFDAHTSRTAWRTRADTIDVVHVQSVGKSGFRLMLAGADSGPASATFGSFAVLAGTYYSVRRMLPYAPSPYGPPPGVERPLEYQCDRRITLVKSIAQSPEYPANIWAVDESGRDADRAVADALAAVRAQSLPWFADNADLEATFTDLRRDCWALARRRDRVPDEFFRREDLFAALAIRLGKIDEATALFETIVARPYDVSQQREHDKQDARRIRRLERSPRRETLVIEPVPFWHDGAVSRLAALAALGKT
jgi:hypothetical protein